MAVDHADDDRTSGTTGPDPNRRAGDAAVGATGADGTSPESAPALTPGAGPGRDAKIAAAKIAEAVAAAEAAGPKTGETVRLDSWIWAVRLVKTRSMGATACRGGHVRVNGERVKPAYSVRVGDEVRLRGTRAGSGSSSSSGPDPAGRSAPWSRHSATSTTARRHRPARPSPRPVSVTEAAGRPTKRDRRELERLRPVAPAAPP
ncbi:hypothetical protein SALBM311S_09205 [Streptomyces alboniger]